MNTIIDIDHKAVEYTRNQENGYFEKVPQIVPFNKLPFDLKVEETQKDHIKNNGANLLIRSRIKSGKSQFFSGLVKTDFLNWYEGNYFEFAKGKKRLSLFVVHFSDNFDGLTIYFFNHFYKENRKHRLQFVNQFIAQKKRSFS